MTIKLRLACLLLTLVALPIAAAEVPSLEKAAPSGKTPTSHPDALLEAVAAAWNAMDIAAYTDALYDGRVTAPDGRQYEPFRFYFQGEPANPDGQGPMQSLELEINNVGKIFSGKDGTGPDGATIPGVRALELTVEKLGEWQPLPIGDSVAGDAYPAGTMRCEVKKSLRIYLKAAPPGRETDYFDVVDRSEFYAIPVQDPSQASVEYRLWKWLALSSE